MPFGPFQGFQREDARLIRVGKAQLFIGRGGASRIPPEDDGKLLPWDGVVGAVVPLP